MKEQKEWNDITGLNRLILKTTWWMVIIIILISVTGVIIVDQYNDRGFFQVIVSNLLLPTMYTVLILTLTQLFYFYFNHWEDNILILGIFGIMHVYIINFPYVPGIHYLLIISVLISALYYQKEKVYFTSLLSLISFFFLYCFYEPFSSGIRRSDIFAFIGIFIGFVFISGGIIYRGHYLLKHLEESMRQQKELLVRNILMDRENFKLPSLRSAVSAGEPLNREVIDVFKAHFNLDVRDGYGQTENTLLLGITKGVPLRPGSMGKPTPGNIVEVVDENGKPCAVGEVGDIAVHKDTPALFKEYFKEPERTRQQFRGEYYITGDRAKKDADGYFWFEGRSDDIIISSGYTIGPFEVEDALVKHTAVKECAVVASPDPIRGNVVKAFIVLRDGIEGTDELVKELQTHVKTMTAPYKYPRKIEFINELPKTASGKTRRVELRDNEQKNNG